MRIKILLTKNTEAMPNKTQSILNSYFHKCLGENNKYHDAKSDYCLSNLIGGKKIGDTRTLNFEKGGFFFVTSLNAEFIGTFLNGIQMNNDFGYGMKIDGFKFIAEEHTDFKNGFNIFRTLTPILLKEYVKKDEYKYITINDDNYVEKLNQYLKNKLSKIDPSLDLSGFNVIIKSRKHNIMKKVYVKNVKNEATQCDLIIYANKKVTETIYNYGVGQSTGCGFGTIYNVKNYSIYADCY